MSTIATPPVQQSSSSASAWSRGPPSSNQSSNVPSGVATPASPPTQNGSGPGHSRKGSMMVGGGVDIKKGPLNFGTVDSPSALLSSSPAAPSTTGLHLTDAVKSFGTIEADANSDAGAMSRRQSTLVSPSPSNGQPAEKKKLDMHALFTNKAPMQDRRLSQSSYQGNGQPNGQAYASQFRPPPPPQQHQQQQQQAGGQSGMPIPPQVQQGFRPQQPMPRQPMPAQQQQMQRPMMSYGQGPYPMMNYQSNYYPGYSYEQQQYGMPPQQWAPQQHPQNQYRSQAQPSPVPPPAQLPSSGGPSPVPTPPTRPPSLMSQPSPVPSTPSRPVSIAPAFTPQPSFTPQAPNFAMSGGAASFTPRTSKAIKFSRPDGTAVDLKQVAAAVKGPTGTPAAEVAPVVEAPAAEIPKKKVPSLPVIVRIESEDQKKARLAEAEQRERIRKQEEQEETERKERKERSAREEEERKTKAEEDRKAKEEEARKLKEKEDVEAKEAEENAKKMKEAEDQKAADKQKEEAIEAEAEAARKAAEERDIIAEAAASEKADAAKTSAEADAATEAAHKIPDEQREQRKSLLTSSATPSPAASPLLPASGLPPKPTTRPPPLEIKSSDVSSALSSAQPIADLHSISYPGSYKPPSPDLNVDAKPGKFRYDRDFLMQFMAVCQEKPDGLPPLEEIGLEADSSSGFGARGGRGGRTANMGPPRGGPAGLGIGNIRPSPSMGMGSFGTGAFGAGNIRGTTSEERYNRSLQNRVGSTARAPSQGNMAHGLPAMTASSSRSGVNRSQRGTRRMPQPQLDPDVAPLVISTNSWVKAKPTNNDEHSPEYIERKVKALLNKLTQEKFDSISNQILEWANKSKDETDGLSLKLVIKQVFEKATDEAHWSAMYAKLCRKLLDCLDPAVTEEMDGKPVSGGTLFRKYLLGRCQVDFESGWKAREDAAAAAAAKSQEDKELLAQQEKDKAEGKETGEAAMLSDEYYIAQKAKRRGLGLVQLIGELFKLEMISKNVIRTCLLKLIGNIAIADLDEEDVESTCKLLTTIGEQYEVQSPENMNTVFNRLDSVLQVDQLPSRVRFMIMDVIDLRRTGWKSRNKQAGVMTIAEIHQQAAQEQAQKAAAQRESISRGGSRAGHSRQQPGEWQNVAAPARATQRPSDFSNFGRISSAGMSNAPTFGPQSHFAKKKSGAAGAATPPLSRQASTANMFGVLGGDADGSPSERRASADASEAQPQRKKLTLAPRTKPVDGEDGEDEHDEAEGSGSASEEEEPEAETAVATGLTETAAKTKIASDLKELWGEKDQGGSRNPEDIAEYFKALPEERRNLLADTLVDEIFRLSKIKDAQVVAKGWTIALDQGNVTDDVLKKGIEKHLPSLDDDSIDFPQAYKAIALLMRSVSISDDELKAYIEKIDFYGGRITPQQKFDKAFEDIDKETAAA